MLEAFEVFNSLSAAKTLSENVLLEKKCSKGTEHIYGIMHALRNNLNIRFKYQKFYEAESSDRLVAPYALREFKGRWYLLACGQNMNETRTFALDRVSELEICKSKFKSPSGFKASKYFENCFGIIKPEDESPEEIILSVEPFQGKYTKSYPLHESQEIVLDNEEELRIKLKLFITHDFIMELLSLGDKVKVLAPESLIAQLYEVYSSAMKKYKV